MKKFLSIFAFLLCAQQIFAGPCYFCPDLYDDGSRDFDNVFHGYEDLYNYPYGYYLPRGCYFRCYYPTKRPCGNRGYYQMPYSPRCGRNSCRYCR